MKRTYTDVLNELSGNRFDIFEEIITKKYQHFKTFYKIIRNHYKDIAYISYRFSDASSLNIDITVNPDVNVKEFIQNIKYEGRDYNIYAKYEKHVVYLSIIMDIFPTA